MMPYTIDLHPEAVAEIEESYNWYEDRSSGLGIRFLDALDKKVLQISDAPDMYPKQKKNYREVAIDNFPFLIIYEVLRKENIIFISYVFHTKRNPKLKYIR